MAEKNSRGKIKPPYQVRLERDLALVRQQLDNERDAHARTAAMCRGAERGAEALRDSNAKQQAALEALGRAVGRCIPEFRASGDVVEHACAVAVELDRWRQAQSERIGELTSEVSRLTTLAFDESVATKNAVRQRNAAQDERHCAFAVIEKLLHALELAPGADRERVLLDALTQMRHLPPFV